MTRGRTAGSLYTVLCLLALCVFTQKAYAIIPGTLNFQNVTATKVVQTVAETPNNEKEVEFGDFDNDDDLDVVIAVAYSDFGTRKNKLYRNDAGVFNEISSTVPLFTAGSGDVARNAFFRDYNLDGWLDIIIVCDSNTGGDGGRTKLWINQHPGGVHTGWTEEGNTRLGSSTGGAACGGVSIDADDDGDADLYVGNYPGPSQDTMYLNDGNGFFTAVTGTHVPNDSAYTVDVASADLNGDGQLDLLLSNHDPDLIYYNNNLSGGDSEGDYRYFGSTQQVSTTHSSENAMEPGDFNGDGLIDVFHSNSNGSTARIWKNTGNDAGNKAVFTLVTNLPTGGNMTRKATVADFNDDGKVDVFVMREGARPYVLRNTSVGGAINFVDWTPAPAFPTSNVHQGWHAAAFDANGDSKLDIFLGGWTNDHLFHNVASNEVLEGDLAGGELPDLHNLSPVAVLGDIAVMSYTLEVLSRDGGAPFPDGGPVAPSDVDSDVYTLNGVPNGATLSAVLNGASDFMLEVLNSSGAVIGISQYVGLGLEEAVQITAPGNVLGIRVTLVEPAVLICDDFAQCADQDDDGIRDDNCVWWECAGGLCSGLPVAFADLAGEFGACTPDGVADANDRFHTLNCFANTTTAGTTGYPCEPAAPSATNVDAGSPFGNCAPDGVCDAHDAFHTLNAFEGLSACSCPGGPAPSGPQAPVVVDSAILRLESSVRRVRPGQTFAVEVYLDSAVRDLRGYQLHLAAEGGTSGRLELIDVSVASRSDQAFDKLGSWQAFNIHTGQMAAGLDQPGVAAAAGDYLATFTYRVSEDAAGTFTVGVLHDDAAGLHRTYLLPTLPMGKIAVAGVVPASISVVQRNARARG